MKNPVFFPSNGNFLLETCFKEVDILRLLNSSQHDNIISFHTAFYTPLHFHIVLEYMDLGDLVTFFNNRPLDSFQKRESLLKFFIKEVLKGLTYLHSLKIIHADLKPENVLVSSKGTVKLADFGHSVILGKDAETIFIPLSTPEYCDPIRHILPVSSKVFFFLL